MKIVEIVYSKLLMFFSEEQIAFALIVLLSPFACFLGDIFWDYLSKKLEAWK